MVASCYSQSEPSQVRFWLGVHNATYVKNLNICESSWLQFFTFISSKPGLLLREYQQTSFAVALS